jgi:hypothetical protein
MQTPSHTLMLYSPLYSKNFSENLNNGILLFFFYIYLRFDRLIGCFRVSVRRNLMEISIDFSFDKMSDSLLVEWKSLKSIAREFPVVCKYNR